MNKLLIVALTVMLSLSAIAQSVNKPYAHMKSGCAETIPLTTLIGNSLAVTDANLQVVHYEFTFDTPKGQERVKVEGNKITNDVILMLKLKKPEHVWIEKIKMVDKSGNYTDSPDMGFNVKY